MYNALTDTEHPTQILADLMTIEEHIKHKPLKEIKIIYVGDTRNNVSNSLMFGCVKMGLNFVAYGPKILHPKKEVIAKAKRCADENGATIEISDDPSCLNGADVLYTDVWVSMGEESQLESRAQLLKDYKITMDMVKQTENDNILFMHCLPAFHGYKTKFVQDAQDKCGIDICEVSDEVFSSKHSVVFTQSANKLPSIKAILAATLSDKLNK